MGPKYIPKVKLKVVNSKISAPKSFKWEPYHMNMALFLRDNYDEFKRAQETRKKIGFLRAMQKALGIKSDECTDVQLKNGYSTFYMKYSGVKQKLNSSGFGVDPEKDSTLDKGWINKACPYFDILDEVLGTRPNVNPPCIVTTSVIPTANTSCNTSVAEAAVENLEHDGSKENEDPVPISENDAAKVNEGGKTTPPRVASPVEEDSDVVEVNETDTDPDIQTQYFVRKALQGVSVKSEAVSTKTPMGMFAKVMEEKSSRFMEVEKEKMKQQQSQFEEEQKLKKEKNEIELLKVNSQMAIEARKVNLEEEKLKDKMEERKHQIEILKLNQEFELKKLELQMKLKQN